MLFLSLARERERERERMLYEYCEALCPYDDGYVFPVFPLFDGEEIIKFIFHSKQQQMMHVKQEISKNCPSSSVFYIFTRCNQSIN
jgi:hypothetical protein